MARPQFARSSGPARRRWLVHMVGVIALVAGSLALTAAPAQASSPWQPVARLSLGRTADIACPSATACWAITGGQLLASTDGGASWTPQSDRVPAGVDVLDRLDCPLVDTCYLAGRSADRSPVMLRLAPAGDLLVPVASNQQMASVSCSTASRCIASNTASVFGTTDSGVTWTQLGTPPLSDTWAVSCAPNSKRCWAAGNSYPNAQVARSLDGGLTWRLQEQVNGIGSFHSIDCPTTAVCLTVGQNGLAGVLYYTHDGGATWSQAPLPASTDPMYSVACGSATDCVATGGPAGAGFGQAFAIGSSDGGASWTRQTIGGSFPVGASAGAPVVSCGSADSCVAVTLAGLGFATTTAGATWTAVPLPASLTSVQDIDCASATSCVGLGQDELLRRIAMVSTDAGVTWSTQVIGYLSGYLGSFECVSTTTCYAVVVNSTFDGQHTKTVGQILYTTDGGASWRINHATAIRNLRAMSCPSTSTCLGIGADARGRPVMLRSTDTFATWQTLTPPADAARVSAVKCASTAVCVVSGVPSSGSGASLAEFTADFGDTFTPVALPDSENGFGLDCAGLTCYAVASAPDTYRGIVAKSVDGGATWRSQHVPAGATRLQNVACSTERICAIAASNGSQGGNGAEMLTTATGGRTWTVQALPAPEVSFPTAVACAGSTCMESDYTANDSPRIMRGMP